MTDPIVQNIHIRAAVDADARDIVDLHFAAVRHHASRFYAADIIDAWSPAPDERRLGRMRRAIASETETILVAESSGNVCGFGSLCSAEKRLQALYVHPDFGRLGIGSALLRHFEAAARESGISELQLQASLNAEAFYRRRGYEFVTPGVHRISGGLEMACLIMRKALRPTGCGSEAR